MTAEEKNSRLILSYVKGIGAVSFQQLLRSVSAFELLEKLSSEQVLVKVGQKFGTAILRARDGIDTNRIFRNLKDSGTQFLVYGEEDYPFLLEQIYDVPPVLYYKGKYDQDKLKKCISIVGTRNASKQGEVFSRKFAMDLVGFGFSVASGMAFGIDKCVHEGAIDAGGYTIAVLGGSADKPYPVANRSTYRKILENGLVISEYPPGINIEPWNFPRRNRIVSGLSLGTLVIEAPRKSGALITAHSAIDQNREVFALPWPIDHKNGEGCNNLISEGKAKLVQNIDDVLVEILQSNYVNNGFSESLDRSKKQGNEISELQNEILTVLAETPVASDQLFDKLGYSIGGINAALSELEVKGMIYCDEKGSWRTV
ncbi:DNA-processing protein DprA [Candidatus Dojkabacteria bacterium]|nr:DNA-processing protein DprA [Candidatus Dojkabacteria bacterium]